MEKKKRIAEKMEKTRQALQELIIKKDNLLDPKVIKASQELDKVLNEYDNILKSNIE